MAVRVLVHILNEDPFIGDMEAMPPANATHIYVTNPHTRDNKQVPWNSGGTHGFIFPLSRISYIEVMVSEAEKGDIKYFSRDNTKGY